MAFFLQSGQRTARLALALAFFSFLAPDCFAGCSKCGQSPCVCGGGGKKGSKHGSSTSVGISVDVTSLFKSLFSGGKKKEPDPDPKTSKPDEPKIASAPKPEFIALDPSGRPPASYNPEKDCCRFTSLRIQNVWTAEVEISIHNQDGVLTGQQKARAGSTVSFQGELGECIRITVKSFANPGLLIEDVRFCCKDIGKRNLYFYGIQILGFTKEGCNKGSSTPDSTPAVAPPTPTPTPESSVTPEGGEDPRDEPVPLPLLPGPGDPGLATPQVTPTPFPTTITRTPSPEPMAAPTPTPTPIHSKPPPPEPTEPLGILLERLDDSYIPEVLTTTKVVAKIHRWDPTRREWVYPGQPRAITFRFTECSNERGPCLNFGDSEIKDLGFDERLNPLLLCSVSDDTDGDTFQVAQTKKRHVQMVAEVSCHDYGAFSRMEATADGCVPLKRVKGKVIQVQPEDARITLPKDDNENQIADAYEDSQGIHPAASEDRDYIPKGNGFDGDGFSAYEEYRGFYVRGKHTRSNWVIKDLMIHDRDMIGFGIYPDRSHVACHSIRDNEWRSSDRVVNFNAGHATLVEQHGLLLITEDLPSGTGGEMRPLRGPGVLGGTSWDGTNLDRFLSWMARRHTGFGPPKNVKEVVIDEFLTGNAGIIAHELGHATGMQHHGDGSFVLPEDTIYPDTWGNWVMMRKTHNGLRVYGHPNGMGEVIPRSFFIGEKNKQRSGHEECIMRYNHGGLLTAYPIHDRWEYADDSNQRTFFCSDATGTGCNSSGHCAEDADRGNCKSQLIISDLFQ